MPSKKVTIIAKPQGQQADDWVNGSPAPAAEVPLASGAEASATVEAAPTGADAAEAETAGAELKRLTIDIPKELHSRIKSQCALRHSKMADEIRLLLDNHFSV